MRNSIRKYRIQCWIFWIAIFGFTLFALLHAFAWNPAECSPAIEDDCHGFTCFDNKTCSCTPADFTEKYNLGQLSTERPWKCDENERSAMPLSLYFLIAVLFLGVGVCSIGCIQRYDVNSCQCEGTCPPPCGCQSSATCNCSLECDGCGIHSEFQVKHLCKCPDCVVLRNNASSIARNPEKWKDYTCQCSPYCRLGCKCGHGVVCMATDEILKKTKPAKYRKKTIEFADEQEEAPSDTEQARVTEGLLQSALRKRHHHRSPTHHNSEV